MNPAIRFLPFALRKRRPIHLTLFLTRRCNARCGFCFYRTSETAKSEELGLDEIGRISRSMGRLLWLAFSGGEIFLRDDLPEISGCFYRNNRPAIMLYPTNGLLPEKTREAVERILVECPESIITVKLSIDAVGGAHDRLRGVEGGFERVLETHGLLSGLLGRHKNFELGVNTVLCASNQDDMDEVIRFVSGMEGIRTHTISLARGDISPEHKGVSPDVYLKTAKSLEQGLKQGRQPVYGFSGGRLKAAQDIIQRRLIHDTVISNSRHISCVAGRLSLVVTETGELYPCESFRPEFRIGSLRDAWARGLSLSDLMDAPETRRMIERIKQECFCTHECYMMMSILFGPRQYPALIKEYLHVAGNYQNLSQNQCC